jgi:hypothetical protein
MTDIRAKWMHAVLAGRGLIAACLLAGCSSAASTAESSKTQEASLRGCDSAIYTASVQEGSSPRKVNAVVIGRAIFNDLRAARTRLDQPRRLVPFYTYKSPLTVWGRSAVSVMIVRPRASARLLYDSSDLRRLGSRAIRLASLPVTTTFELCRHRGSGALMATQYNGGFALLRPQCVTLAVRSEGTTRTRLVAFGVRHC